MKNYSSLKKAALLSVSMLVGMSAANAHTTNLDASVLGNCDALTSFARNADHNDAQMSKEQKKSYVDARVACQVQHQDQHLQSEKYFAIYKFTKEIKAKINELESESNIFA